MATSLEHVEKFQRWMDKVEMNVNPKLCFQVADTGRGVWAAKDIEEDELLFRIPFRCVLSALTTDCPSISTIDGYEGSEWNALCIAILYEYSKGESSFWYHYLHHFLPLSPSSPPTPYAPLFWKETKADLLQGTESYGKWQEQMEQIDSLWEHASLFLAENAQLFGSLNKTIKSLSTKDFFSRIYFLVQSYSFTLDSLSLPSDCGDLESLTGMCPMADALNHRTGQNNARLFTHSEDPEENPKKKASELYYEMSSIQAIPKGNEIFNTYGELPNSSLLVSYGFMDAENGNDYLTFSVLEVLCQCAKLVFPGEVYAKPMERALELLLEEESEAVSGSNRNGNATLQNLPNGFEEWKIRVANHIFCLWGLSETIQLDAFVFDGPIHVFGFVEEEPSPDLALSLFIQYITCPVEIAKQVDVIIATLAKESSGGCCSEGSSCASESDCPKPCCDSKMEEKIEESCCKDPSACKDICTKPNGSDMEEEEGKDEEEDMEDEEEDMEDEEGESGGWAVISEILEVFEAWTGKQEILHKTIELIVQTRREQYATISESKEIPETLAKQIVEKEKDLLSTFYSVHESL